MTVAKACDIIVDMKPTFGHCALVTGVFAGRSAEVPNGVGVVHATSAGVVEGGWGGGRAYCFRSRHITRAEAEDIQKVADEIRYGAQYGACRAVFKSWSGSSSFGKNALARLEKYQSRRDKNDQQVLKNVYCSELVVVAYQLGLHINQRHAAWIDLDGMHTLPSTLKSWLERHPTNWTCVGMVTDGTLTLSAR